MDTIDVEVEPEETENSEYTGQNRYPVLPPRPIQFIKERKLLINKLHPPRGLFLNSQNPVAYQLIKKAKKSIDIEIYEMKDKLFRNLLLEAASQRKVKVRILSEANSVGNSCNELSPEDLPTDTVQCKLDKEFVRSLLALGGVYKNFNKELLCGIVDKKCWMHGKMMIVDGTRVLLSTGNFNDSSFCNLEAKPRKCNRDYSYLSLTHIFSYDFRI